MRIKSKKGGFLGGMPTKPTFTESARKNLSIGKKSRGETTSYKGSDKEETPTFGVGEEVLGETGMMNC